MEKENGLEKNFRGKIKDLEDAVCPFRRCRYKGVYFRCYSLEYENCDIYLRSYYNTTKQ